MSESIMDDRYVCSLEQQVIDLTAEVENLRDQVRRWEDKEVDRASCCAYFEERCKELEGLLLRQCHAGCGECDACNEHNGLPTAERISWMSRLDKALESIK
jgi:hypothetical protein